MPTQPFVRYLVKGISISWWTHYANSFLNSIGWSIIDPRGYSYSSSYGFDPNLNRHPTEVRMFDYFQSDAAVILERRGQPNYDSVWVPSNDRTVVDDLLAFMSLYTGNYCQYLVMERNTIDNNFRAAFAAQINHSRNTPKWAGPRSQAVDAFVRIQSHVPSLDSEQLRLAMRWFFSALMEYELPQGRPLVEAAMNWVSLEAQATLLGYGGSKFERVTSLLTGQGFTVTPHLRNLYRLRNDAFHDGALSHLEEDDAQLARSAGMTLARAQILNFLGMPLEEINDEFKRTYSE